MEGNNPYRAPFKQGGSMNAPFQPPNVNGYIQPRPRQTPQRPPEGVPPRMPQTAPVAPPINTAVGTPASPTLASEPDKPVWGDDGEEVSV
jgi:hypothetical protein